MWRAEGKAISDDRPERADRDGDERGMIDDRRGEREGDERRDRILRDASRNEDQPTKMTSSLP